MGASNTGKMAREARYVFDIRRIVLIGVGANFFVVCSLDLNEENPKKQKEKEWIITEMIQSMAAITQQRTHTRLFLWREKTVWNTTSVSIDLDNQTDLDCERTSHLRSRLLGCESITLSGPMKKVSMNRVTECI